MEKLELDRYIIPILKGLTAVCIIGGILLLFKITFNYFMPIFIATLFSMFLDPMVKLLQKLKFNRVLATLISMFLFIGALVTAAIFGISRAITELSVFYDNIPEYSTQFYKNITDLIEAGRNLYFQLPPEAINLLQQSVGGLFERLTALVSTLTTGVLNTVSSLPGILIFSIITLIATFFITKDKELIKAFFLRQFSDNTQKKILSLKNDLLVALLGFAKAQLIFITVTFIESFIGLSLIGVEYAFIIALIVAFVDILPVLGTGSIYVPWAITSLIYGNYVLGFSILGLWAFIFIVRYIIEPKVYGHQLGIHPLLALASIFAGLKLIGVAGLILGPATVVILLACQKAGIIPSFK